MVKKGLMVAAIFLSLFFGMASTHAYKTVYTCLEDPLFAACVAPYVSNVTGGGGGSCEGIHDQDLNTTSNVTFNYLNITGYGDGDVINKHYDILINGNYGAIEIGELEIFQSDISVGALNLNGTAVFRNENPASPTIQFLFATEASEIRFAIPVNDVPFATQNVRSLMVGGDDAQAFNDNVVNCTAQGYEFIDCDTDGTGADLGVKDDLEVRGSAHINETINATNYIGNGTSLYGILLQDGSRELTGDWGVGEYNILSPGNATFFTGLFNGSEVISQRQGDELDDDSRFTLRGTVVNTTQPAFVINMKGRSTSASLFFDTGISSIGMLDLNWDRRTVSTSGNDLQTGGGDVVMSTGKITFGGFPSTDLDDAGALFGATILLPSQSTTLAGLGLSQTWSGTNKFQSATTYFAADITHDGDTDTELKFSPDDVYIIAGGQTVMRGTESGGNVALFLGNPTGTTLIQSPTTINGGTSVDGWINVSGSIHSQNGCGIPSAVIEYERGTIVSNQYWSLGNGRVVRGAPQACSGNITAFACYVGVAGTSMHCAIRVSHVTKAIMWANATNHGVNYTTGLEIPFQAGDVIGFRAENETGAFTDGIATVYLRFD